MVHQPMHVIGLAVEFSQLSKLAYMSRKGAWRMPACRPTLVAWAANPLLRSQPRGEPAVRGAATLNVPTLTDLGDGNAGDGFRHPVLRLQVRAPPRAPLITGLPTVPVGGVTPEIVDPAVHISFN
ncbi:MULTISPECIES: hypothetical protein [unclassified Streptomyces]|uniref:hypothetical protein n=1 Tax=unclassified Streptomyces TaxID=2593676 RepID=UPI0033A67CC0